MGQTVNLLVYTFGGSNPSLPTQRYSCCYSSAVEHFLGKEEVPGSSPGNSSQEVMLIINQINNK